MAGLIHSNPIPGLVKYDFGLIATVSGSSATATYSRFEIGPLLMHGFMLSFPTGTSGASTSTWPTFGFQYQMVNGSVNLGQVSGQLNLCNDVYSAAGEVTAVQIWVPAVQARRFAGMKDESVLSIYIVNSSTSTTVWPTGNWLGASTNTTRFLASGSTTAPNASQMSFIVGQAAVATGTGVVDSIWCYALATRFPYNKRTITADEIAEADANAQEFLTGGMLGGPIYGLGAV